MSTFSQMTGNFKEAWSGLFSDHPSGEVSKDPIAPQFSDLVKETHSDTVEITVISQNTEIRGSMTSRANIKIAGFVKGNITSGANITVSGIVEGDITGEYVSIQNGSVTGNIISKTCIIISEKSMIEGDIECDRLTLNGNVKGNIQVQTSATLGSIAIIHGNLASRYLSIQEGAIVDGLIKVDRDTEPSAESLFQVGFKMPALAECM